MLSRLLVHRLGCWVIALVLCHAARADIRQQDEALRVLLGCDSMQADRDSDDMVRSLEISYRTGSPRLTALTTLPRLEALTIYGSVTDADVQAIARCSQLRGLDLNSPAMTDVSAEAIGSLRNLEALRIPTASITDAGARWLAQLQSLRELDLSRTAIGDAGLEHLAALSKLAVVDLSETKIRDSGLRFVAAWHALRTLDLSKTALDGSGFDALAKLDDLASLDISHCEIRDEGLTRLAPLRNLMSLDLNGNENLGDTGLATLANMPFLRSLAVARTGITSAGLAAIGPHEFVMSANLERTAIDDSAIETLLTFPNLRNARFSESRVSLGGLRRLAKGAPKLTQLIPPSHWSVRDCQRFGEEFPRLVAMGCGAGVHIPWHEQLDRARKVSGLSSELTRAVTLGDFAEVERQLDAGASVEAKMRFVDTGGTEWEESTILLFSLLLDHTRIASMLIDRGADVNATLRNGRSAVHLAAANGDLAVLDALLRHGANPNREGGAESATPLQMATWTRNRLLVERLLAGGADPAKATEDHVCPLVIAIDHGDLEIAKSMLAVMPRSIAATAIRPLVFRATDAGARDMLSRIAMVFGSLSSIESELDSSLLARAIQQRADRETLELMISLGADPNRASPARSRPLWEAIDAESAEAVEVLLAHGVDRTLRDDEGRTALEYARSVDASASILVLLES